MCIYDSPVEERKSCKNNMGFFLVHLLEYRLVKFLILTQINHLLSVYFPREELEEGNKERYTIVLCDLAFWELVHHV